MGPKRKIESDNYKEGASWRKNKDGSTHESKWYSNDHGSARTSRDYGEDGKVSNEHTTKQK